MISAFLLKKPIQYYEAILDIVQFGSSIQIDAMPNDIDIAILYKEIPLKMQLEISQKIKQELETQTKIPIHIKSYTFETLFDPSNFAKTAILTGISLFTHKFFASRFGLVPQIHITYSLEGLNKAGKVRFNYFLNGKKGNHGFLKDSIGRLVKPGYLYLNPLYEYAFFKKMKETITYKKEIIFASL